jgi:nucleotide-binding universal stress UspA family protein
MALKITTMKKIIVPVDFSITAENAAVYAANVAGFYRADIWLFYNYSLISTMAEYGYASVSEAEMESAANFELEAFKQKILSQLTVPINIFIKSETGDLIESLNNFCAEIEPDMVVFGLSGKNALARLVVGSNTIRAIHHLKYPVLVVPPKAVFIPIRKMGFACDYRKILQTTSLSFFKKMVKDFNADLYVLNVEYKRDEESAEAVAESMHISELLKELKPNYSAIYSPDITVGINWFAEKEKIDWMLMIPRQHNLIDKIFGRSHTKALLYHTNIPVLCMHE